jgi:hypothetical protein
MNDFSQKNTNGWALFLLRLGVFIVMFAWTLDTFISPEHSANIFHNFYFINAVGSQILMIIGRLEMLIILAFLGGIWKRWTDGFVMPLHAVSTFSSWQFYTIKINLLFFAAWPMLAACVALYLLRDLDVKFTLKIS